MADYCTSAEVKADMPGSGLASSTDMDATISSMITIASRAIDREVGRWDNFFYPTTDDQTRYFDGSGELEQPIDEMVSLTSVSVSESDGRASTSYTDWTEDTDYYVWPYNYASIGKPIQKLIVDNDSGSKGVFYRVRKGVKVSGVFGYASSPPDTIKQACKMQVIRWVMKAKQAYQQQSANAQVGQKIYTELDPDIKDLLRPYKLEMMV